MNYFITETNTESKQQKTAGIKARDDIERILSRLGYIKIALPVLNNKRKKQNGIKKIKWHIDIYKTWLSQTRDIKGGDTLIIQFPVIEHTILLSHLIKKYMTNGVRVILLIHDLELLRISMSKEQRFAKRIRLKIEEKGALGSSSYIISHNKHMTNYLVDELRVDRNKIVSLGIFDYLINDFEQHDHSLSEPIIIAGNLSKIKSEYIYKLPQNIDFNLYGVNYEPIESNHIHYMGAFEPDELPNSLRGSFGLVWDGSDTRTCTGVYGKYLLINNPHKTSLYLASGIPVIIWKKAALANFIEKNNCGITVNSIDEISSVLSTMSISSYNRLKDNSQLIGKKLRAGFYTTHALSELD